MSIKIWQRSTTSTTQPNACITAVKNLFVFVFFFFFFFFNQYFLPPSSGRWFLSSFFKAGEFFDSLWCKPMEARSLLATRVVEFCSSRLLSVPFLFCFLFWFFSYRSFTSSRLRGMDVLGVSATKAFWQCFLGDIFFGARSVVFG
jgi:hypothetical protein